MKWWTLEQALAWIMWRDEARAGSCGDGRRGAIEARQLAEVPRLSDGEWQLLVADLLERGEVSFTPMPASGPCCGFEERGYEHEASGCYVLLRGWRERADAPLCFLEALHWVPPREEPILDYLTAKGELERALREGRVHAVGEGSKGETVALPPESWLYARVELANDFSGKVPDGAAAGPRMGRLRFPVDEIKAMWPNSECGPGTSLSEGSRYRRKRGRPRTSTETHVMTARAMLERGLTQKEVTDILRDAIAKERNVGQPAALKAAKAILAQACIQNS